jgi:hypothetical protein
MSQSPMKPLIAAGAIVALDKYVLNQQNLNSSLYFGVAGAAGIYAAQMLVPMIPDQKSGSMIDPKTLEGRILEVGLGAGAVYGLNRFVLNNDLRPNDMAMKLAIIAGADFIAEYASDYLTGKPLSFLK